MMDSVTLALLVLAALVALPAYLYVLSKFMQVGRMAGARWFSKNCGRKGS